MRLPVEREWPKHLDKLSTKDRPAKPPKPPRGPASGRKEKTRARRDGQPGTTITVAEIAERLQIGELTVYHMLGREFPELRPAAKSTISLARYEEWERTFTPQDKRFWSLLGDTYAVFSDQQDDGEEAHRAWGALSRCSLDEGKTDALVSAAWRYAFARRVLTINKKGRRGDADKAARLAAADLAKRCRNLENSFLWVLRPITSDRTPAGAKHSRTQLLLANVLDGTQVASLANQLGQTARALGKLNAGHSQSSINSGMKKDALLEMVCVAAESGKKVPWTALARLVSLLSQGDSGPTLSVSAQELELEYSRMPAAKRPC
jgi:hypothetical protein